MRLNQDLIQRMFDGRGGVAGGGSSLDPGLINGLATEMWTEENYVSKTFFNELFVIHKKTTTTVYDGDTVVSTTVDTSGTFAPNEIPSQEESTDEETGYRTVVVTEVDNIEAKKGLWTDFFLSALGLNGSGGGGGIGDVTWQALGDNTDTRQIASSHLTTALGSALAGYATQSWVTSQNYVTSSAISDMATKTWVNNQSFVNWTALGDTTTTQQIALSHLTTALSGYATQTWVTNNFSTPSTVATQLQTYAKIQNGTITIGDTSITPITSVTGTFWGKSFTNGGTVNGTIKAGSNGGAIEQFHSVEMNSAGTLAGYGGFIDFHYYATGSTFDSSLDYTSRIIESEVGVISILAKNNNATNANKLAGLLVGDGYDGSYVQIGNIRIVYDSTNNALKVVKLVSGSEVAANFYATGSVSALGYGSGGGGGTGDVTWTNLADNTDTRQIALSHLTGALSGYATTSQLAGYLPLTAGSTKALTGDLYISKTSAKLRIANATSSATKTMLLGQWDGTNNRIETTGADLFITIYGTSGLKIGRNGYGDDLQMDSSGNFVFGTETRRNQITTYGKIFLYEALNFIRENWNYITVPATSGNIAFNIGDAGTANTKMLIDNSGNVGIGTIRPTYMLDVNGVARCTYMYFKNYDDSGAGLSGYVGRGSISSNNIQLIAYTGNDLELGANGATAVVINSSSNVGIGTLSPSYKLHVVGNVFGTSFVKDGGTSSQFLKADGSIDSNTYITSASLTGYLPLTAGSTKPLTGDLYISKSSAKLTIANATSSATKSMSLGQWDATNNRIETTGADLFVTIYGSYGLKLGHNGHGDDFVIDASGNVEIGTETSRTILTTHGSILLFESLRFTRESWNYICVPATNGQIAFNIGSAGTTNTKMLIDNSGNVGIGTIAQTHKLDVSGTVGITGNTEIGGTLSVSDNATFSKSVIISSDDWYTFKIDRGTTYGVANIGGINSDGVYFSHTINNVTNYMYLKAGLGLSVAGAISSTGSSTALSFIKSGGTSAQFLKADGSVDSTSYATASSVTTLQGYFTNGVANEAAKLSTVSKTAWGQTYWTSGGVPDSISGNMSNVGDISFSASGKNIGGVMYFDTTNKRVGINTSSPDCPFVVYNRMRVFTVDDSISFGQWDGSNNRFEFVGRPVLFTAYGSYAISFGHNGNGSDLYIASGGSVGIATTSPSYKLHVSGTVGLFESLNFTRESWNYITVPSSTGYLSFNIGPAGTAYTKMCIITNGNVGIGTTAPSYKLDVNGSFNASGDTLLGSNVSDTTTVYHKMVVGAANYTNSPYVQIGKIRFVYNDTDNAIRVVREDGTAANLYATGGISALGYQSGGGGGGSTGVFSTSITPDTTGVYDLGTSTYKWRNLYLAGANGGNGFSIMTSYNNQVYIGSVNKIYFGSSDVEFEDTVYVENRMGIGTKNGNYDLYVYGENEGNAYFWGDVSVASLTNRSDMRLKDVVGDVNLSVQQIASAPAFKFRFKEKAKRTMVGTSAQYWDAVLPESVTRDADGILGLDYGVTALVSTIILAKGMTEHERRITKLEMENAELRARIKDLEEN